uniref:30S ribosomal protein S12-B, chloroplastic n=1 Tax=Lygus hesperus TaxID=30085 RepID=A0A0A9YM93_LYGHE
MGTASSVTSKISERTQHDSDMFVRSIRLMETSTQQKQSSIVTKKPLYDKCRKYQPSGGDMQVNLSSSTPAMSAEPCMKPLRSTSSSDARLKMYNGIGGCDIQNHWDAMANESRVRLPVHKKWRRY